MFVKQASEPVTRPEILPLTGLRFFAALSIAAAHLSSNVMVPGWGHPLSIAPLGMPLFFTLSGFIIHYVYSAQFNRAWSATLGEFALARFSRLYPLFLFFVIYNLLFHDFWNVLSHPVIGISYLTLTATWWPWQVGGHTIDGNTLGLSWSIPTEVFFYICYALVLHKILSIRSRKVAIAGLLLMFVFAYSLLYVIWKNEFTSVQSMLLAIFPDGMTYSQSQNENVVEWFIYLSPYIHIMEFISGVFVCQIYLLSQAPSRLLAEALFWGGFAGVVIMLWFLNYVDYVPAQSFSSASLQTFGSFYHYLQRSFLLVPTLSAIILGAAFGNCTGARMLSGTTLVLLGESSYSLYLGHSWAGAIAGVPPGFPHPYLGVMFVLFVACALAVGLFLLIERPAKRLLRRIFHVAIWHIRRGKAVAPTQ
jgi:peptidoglycan/LPS O-acetylase OafA/YrhL